MKYIDFSFQTLVFLFAGIFGSMIILDDYGVAPFFIIQFCLGCWQMLSSGVFLIVYNGRNKPRLRHFILAVIYLLVLFIGGEVKYSSDTMAMIFQIVPPWSLAIYYYIITCRETFPRPSTRSSFLTHISF